MIGILGATGYTGLSIGREIARRATEPLVLLARSPDVLRGLIWPDHVSIRSLDGFRADQFDLVVNAIGAGAPRKVAALGTEILHISRYWDERVLDTMASRTQYVFLSSGAVYGTTLSAPVTQDSELSIPVNRLEAFPAYVLAKLNAEKAHRTLPDISILDVRIFAYADISVPLSGGFFLSDLVRSIMYKETFSTSSEPLVRDYVGTVELLSMIDCWRAAGAPNRALDIYSLAPVEKANLLDVAKARYGLNIEIIEMPVGGRQVYTSSFFGAKDIGYAPQRSSMDIMLSILDEAAKGQHR
jgi:nucleoside-diphosphate-sugar epimerase